MENLILFGILFFALLFEAYLSASVETLPYDKKIKAMDFYFGSKQMYHLTKLAYFATILTIAILLFLPLKFIVSFGVFRIIFGYILFRLSIFNTAINIFAKRHIFYVGSTDLIDKYLLSKIHPAGLPMIYLVSFILACKLIGVF
jgi:hypothetical protein